MIIIGRVIYVINSCSGNLDNFMDVHDQDSNHGPDDMSTKIEAEVKIEVESDAESDAEKEDEEKTVSTTSAKSVKQELVKSGSHLFTLSIGTF